jgi:hypothetical protein
MDPVQFVTDAEEEALDVDDLRGKSEQLVVALATARQMNR